MGVCKNCGAEYEEGNLFCRNCGNKIEQEAPNEIPEIPDLGYGMNVSTEQKPGPEKKKSNLIPLIISIAAVVIAAVIILVPKFTSSIITGDSDGGNSNGGEADGPAVSDVELIDMSMIDSIIRSDANGANISLCVVDIKNGKTYTTANAERQMSASALVNIPILYSVARELEENRSSWDSRVTFRYRYGGRGNIKKDQDGNAFELGYLVKQMLNYSDNNATNSLLDYYGRSYISNLLRNDSFYSVDIQRYLGESSQYKDNYISARDTAEMLAYIYTEADGPIDKAYLMSNFMIYDNAAVKGIGRNLTSGARFLNHNAVTDSIYNEVAIVSSVDAEYVIAFLSNNGRMSTSADTASRISDYVYNSLSR